MPLDLSIPASPTIALFVEDVVTHDYLQAVWGNPITVAFRLGGGNEGVCAIVQAFREAQYPNVFGIIDRDFEPSNQADWAAPNRTFRTFVLPVHEIENYLLDAEALHASRYHNRGLSVERIEAQMVQKAGQLCWWAACRETIAELKRRFRQPFVGDPSQAVVDEPSARLHICGSPWFTKLADEAAQSTEADIHALLAANHAIAVQQHRDGTWRREFAGKEILRDVAGWMCDRQGVRQFPKRDADFYADIAKGIAAWQVNHGQVHADLTALLSALNARIARI